MGDQSPGNCDCSLPPSFPFSLSRCSISLRCESKEANSREEMLLSPNFPCHRNEFYNLKITTLNSITGFLKHHARSLTHTHTHVCARRHTHPALLRSAVFLYPQSLHQLIAPAPHTAVPSATALNRPLLTVSAHMSMACFTLSPREAQILLSY